MMVRSTPAATVTLRIFIGVLMLLAGLFHGDSFAKRATSITKIKYIEALCEAATEKRSDKRKACKELATNKDVLRLNSVEVTRLVCPEFAASDELEVLCYRQFTRTMNIRHPLLDELDFRRKFYRCADDPDTSRQVDCLRKLFDDAVAAIEESEGE